MTRLGLLLRHLVNHHQTWLAEDKTRWADNDDDDDDNGDDNADNADNDDNNADGADNDDKTLSTITKEAGRGQN